MEMTTVKTFAVFAIIFGCFAVLYPKIFHPMVLQIFGFGDYGPNHDLSQKMPPHLKKPGGGRLVSGSDDLAKHMKHAGPHPGLRAAAEMKKQAAGQGQGGGGKGMMGIVLPMYAVGIVVYLIYTMTKVFGNKKDKEKDFLSSHFNDVQYDPTRKKFISTENADNDGETDEADISLRFKNGRRNLERLLLKADRNNINANEVMELKRRLLETEQQMTRILSAMETVQSRVGDVVSEAAGNGASDTDPDWVDEDVQIGDTADNTQDIEVEQPPQQTVDSSPDMETYEIIKGGRSPAMTPKEDMNLSPSIEVIGCLDGDQEPANNDKDEPTAGAKNPHEPESLSSLDDGCQEETESQEEVIHNPAAEDCQDEHPDLRKRLPRDSKISDE